MDSPKIHLNELYFLFFKIGSVTFGGGYTMLPMLDRELSEKRRWVTEEELLDYYAIGQSTPGIIAINTATFVGYKTAGIPGAIAATLGMVSPSLIIIILIAAFLRNFNEVPLVQKALKGVNIAVAVLLIFSVWKFAQKTVKDIPGFLICLTAFLAVGFGGISPIPVVALSAFLGIVIPILKRRKK
ncbi:chromate transporter [Oceanispirochaeta sp.]|jgi:chromate transporter|uniref:chromate transporter n=1 Tax=Oceanispirochaeta sp. TaxID=2035350 RepID=UPI0026229DDB|nr:chromate transporter [Oceanispirochaeta sp.]MDA3958071.1 chromate transporter [Oceanispirochaeta sp.]